MNATAHDAADRPVIPRLELEGVTKRFPGVVANEDVDLRVMPGEIHALLGENGAGKSTLVKCMYGVHQPDEGRIHWEGDPVTIATPAQARHLGIGMVFQHFSLFETLTIAENIALGLEDVNDDPRNLDDRIVEVSELYGLPLDPRRTVLKLSVGERQRVEIVRCLLQHPGLLIMDEPTSVLTPTEIERLFTTLRQLRDEGISILYISHKLAEIQQLCESATVLRHGRVSAHCDPREETPHSLAEMMIGSEIPRAERPASTPTPAPVLRLDGLSRPTDDPFGVSLVDMNLDVHGGEVMGIAGVSGNGQAELMRLLSGEDTSGDPTRIRLGDEAVGGLDPAERRRRGIAFVPEERLGRGSVPDMDLVENTLLTGAYQGLVGRGFIHFARARQLAERIRERFDVRTPSVDAQARSLSGGNLQKFIVGREIEQHPRVLIAGQPTWGVDVGAAAAIHQALVDLRAQGCALLVFSEDLDELFEISDRVAVIFNGHLSPAKPVAETSYEEVGRWMGGLFPGADGGSTREGAHDVA
ncbi:ABC transporter ATP-binding protein [Arhodomonas aquaeolei]|uniref:ABC transporter ATP-binding protein n=1 Tax=Arhodomonas aquaeolei TaxID=2369 RepID=UPI0021672682|nr:ABC transporter ATP-binding protein [Arhodomonas aquaeolei]MCS4504911.1 ABC transporter ATP-binding protein [Arhodomonas aquaeolei]